MRRPGRLALLTLVACQPASTPTQVAHQFIAAYHDGDYTRFRARFVDPPNLRFLQRKDAWIRERIGACDHPEPLWSRGPLSTRFRYQCERGAIEASFTLDDRGRITDFRHGAVGIPPDERVASALRATVATLPWTAATAPAGVDQDATRPYARALGRCEVDRPWLVSRGGGLFHLRCEWGDAIVRFSLADDGRLLVFNILPPSARRDAGSA